MLLWRSFVIGFGLAVCAGRIGHAEALSPVEIVKSFYSSVRAGECAAAESFRPDYSKEHCLDVKDVRNLSVEAYPSSRADTSVVHISVTVETRAGSASKIDEFSGYAGFVKRTGVWLWVPDTTRKQSRFTSVTEYSDFLDRRIAEFDANLVSAPAAPAVSDESAADTSETADTGEAALAVENVPSPVHATAPRVAVDSRPTVRVPTPNKPIQSTRDEAARAFINACWTADELRNQPGEKKVEKAAVLIENRAPEVRKPTSSPVLVNQSQAGSIRSVDTRGEPLIALTFDFCERLNETTGYDGGIVDFLRDNRVKATFYLGGKWMQSHEERAMQMMSDPLFEVGNHGWTHGNFRVLSEQEAKDQVEFTLAEYQHLRTKLLARECAKGSDPNRVAPTMTSFRFPYGTCTASSLDLVNQLGFAAVQWDVVTADPAVRQSAKAITGIVLKRARPGSIIVMHGNGRGWHTEEALRTFVPELRAAGFQFVTVRELLAKGRPVTVNQCYEMKPGDNEKYDLLVGIGTGEKH